MTMRPTRISTVVALLLGTIIASCTGSAGTSGADAAMSVDDLAPVDDLSSSDIDESSDDVVVEEALDASVDVASMDLSVDSVVDVATDHPEVLILDVPSADVPGLHVGSAFIPVDPNAVPAPGSECVGDAGVREGDPAIAPPRPVRPLSVSRVTSQRPTFQWVLPEGTTGARVEVCADRCCTRVLQTIDAEGTTVRPITALPPGVVFWRMFGRRGTAVGSRASYTWEFGVRRRDAPNDTSWGTIRDFNGDGYDDVMMFRPRREGTNPTDLLLVPGSADGLRTPTLAGMMTEHAPSRAMVGDFNGDGLADIAWNDSNDAVSIGLMSWFVIVTGSRERMASTTIPEYSAFGLCARTSGGRAVDWNGDGYSDLIAGILIGCDFYAPVTASVLLIYLGSSTGISSVPQLAWRMDGHFAHSFVRLSGGVGDVDNDGHGDVFVVSRFVSTGTSSVPAEQALLYGSSAAEPLIARVSQPTPLRGDWESGRAASAGDIDGDGYLDILMSLNYSNPIYLYRHTTGLARPAAELGEPIAGSEFGYSFSQGDLNGDGLSDVIVSAVQASTMERDGLPINVGRVYVFTGSGSGIVPSPLSLERARPHNEQVIWENFGGQSMSPGDANGDGIDDLVLFDSLGSRLCTSFGRVGYAGGSPDVCLDGVTIRGSLNY